MAVIPPALESELIEKAAQGASTRDLSQWLKDAKGITASYRAVQRLLSRTKSERADVAKAIVREKLTKEAPRDLERLEAELAKAERLSDRLHARAHKSLDALEDPEKADPGDLRIAVTALDTVTELALKATAQVNNVAKTKLHFSGADTPDDSFNELSQAEQRLTRRMDSLAERVRPREDAERASPDPPREGGS